MPNLFVSYYATNDGKLSIKSGDRIKILRVRPLLDEQDELVIKQLQSEGKSREAEEYGKRIGEKQYISEYVNHTGVVNQIQIQLGIKLGAEFCMVVDFGDGNKTDVFNNNCDFEIVSRAEDNPQVQVGDRVVLGAKYQWNRGLDRQRGDSGRVVGIEMRKDGESVLRELEVQLDRDGAIRVLTEWEFDLTVLDKNRL